MQESVGDAPSFDSRPRLGQSSSGNRPFIVVWLALFIVIMGVTMVSPLLPVFAEDMGASGVSLISG